MARKSKIDSEKQANGQRSEPTARRVGGNATAEPKAINAKLKGKKAASKSKTVPGVKPVDPKKPSLSLSSYEPPDEDIRIRAYFIAERRIQLRLQGDSDHDWIEARRQLVEEANRRVNT